MNVEKLREVVRLIEQTPDKPFSMSDWATCLASWIIIDSGSHMPHVYDIPGCAARLLDFSILESSCLFDTFYWETKYKNMHKFSETREDRVSALKLQVEFVIAGSQNLVL